MLRLIERCALWGPVFALLAVAVLLAAGGWDRFDWTFLADAPRDLGRQGGIAPVMLNTVAIVVASLLMAVPLALATAFALVAGPAARPGGWARRAGRRLIDTGLCLPRLLWGLAGGAIFGGGLGLGLSAATGALTLGLAISPILVTAFVEAFEQAMNRLGPACRALGMSEGQLWRAEVLPAARGSLAAGCLLAAGRACGDAAALLLTAGVGARLIGHPADSASTLAVHIYVLVVEVGGGIPSAMAAGCVLLAITALVQLPIVAWGARRSA
jgi:phosphate transport system permease protein